MSEHSLLNSLWVARLANYKSIRVGFSGGLDSTVLLHLLSNTQALKKTLSAVHIHHGLSPHADAWQKQCEIFCAEISIPLTVAHVKIDNTANIEERARKARYSAFESLLEEGDALLLAHHQQDQAETLLLHLFRGAGVDGLAAMPIVRPLSKGELVRPLLHCSRESLESYAKNHSLTYINDESNENIEFSRNYIRHHVMPMIRNKWPNVAVNLAACARNCQDASKNLEALASIDYKYSEDDKSSLLIEKLPLHDKSRLVNVLRIWLKKNCIRSISAVLLEKLINEVILARIDAKPYLSCGHVSFSRYKNKIYILNNSQHLDSLSNNDKPITYNAQKNVTWSDFPSPLVLNYGKTLQAQRSPLGIYIPNGSNIEVRYRQGGEVFRLHGQTKQLKKLFQQWGVPPYKRNMIPLIYVNNDLKVVVGFKSTDEDDALDTKSKYMIIYRDE